MLWTLAIKGGCAISCARGVLDPNQKGGARYRLHGDFWTLAVKGVVQDIVCAGGSWTAAIQGRVRDIVCAGGCWTAAIEDIKGGVHGGVLFTNQKGRAPYRLRGGCRTLAIKGGVRDIVCAGGGAGPLQSNQRAGA